MSKDSYDHLRRFDVEAYRRRLEELAAKPLTQPEFTALASFVMVDVNGVHTGRPPQIYAGRYPTVTERLHARGYVRWFIDNLYPVPVVRLDITTDGLEAYQVRKTELALEAEAGDKKEPRPKKHPLLLPL